MHEKMFDAAWAAVRRYGASMGAKEALARTSEATHPREVVDVYAERVDQFANAGGNQAYAEAAKLIARMATFRGAAEQAAYVAALKERFGRKRNLMNRHSPDSQPLGAIVCLVEARRNEIRSQPTRGQPNGETLGLVAPEPAAFP